MKTTIETFNTHVSTIAHLLEKQAQLAHVSGEQAARQCYANSGQIDVLLSELEYFAVVEGLLPHVGSIISALRTRKWNLPSGPQWRTIKQVQQLLAFPNLLFLAYEETMVSGLVIPEIARLVVIDSTGTPLFDHSLQTGEDPLPAQRSNVSPLLQDQPGESAAVWSALHTVVAGRYTLCDNLFLLQTLLIDTAKRLDLEPPVLIGQSISQLLVSYIGGPSYDFVPDLDEPSEEELASLYERLGVTLPRTPHATALDQVRAQLHLLQAMAQGIIVA